MKRKVYITILGKEVLPVYYPIEVFSVTEIYVIGTEENHNGNVYASLENYCKSQGYKIHFIQVEAYNILSTMTECERIHSMFDKDTEFLYNITGGTKIMALGAYRIAINNNASIIYTNSKEYIDLNTYETKHLSCRLSNEAIFKLQGQELKSYTKWDNSNEYESIIASRMIRVFIIGHYSEYKELSDHFLQYQIIPNSYQTRSLSYSFIDGQLQVEKDGIEILSIYSSNAKELLFRGRWWECLVAEAISNWSNGQYEIWHSVVFKTTNSTYVHPQYNILKNEVDILVNIGNTIVFVECKSGSLTQNEIFKMDYIKKTYGSDKSKSVLITFRPLNADLKNKAIESRISFISPKKREQDVLQIIPDKMDEIVNSLTL